MMNNWMGRAILYLIIVGGLFLSLQYTTNHFKPERQIILLNTTRPDFHAFLNTEKQNTRVYSKSSFKPYIDYFRLVTEAMPENSEGYLMLGYLYEITADNKQAKDLLEKSYHSNPSFFFTGFDLALINYHQGEYAKAIELLEKSLGFPPQETLGQMMNSILYRQLFVSMSDSQEIIFNLSMAYRDAYLLLIDSLARSGQSEQKLQAAEAASKIFPDDPVFLKVLQGENDLPQVHPHIM